jgi:hypothetical protein
MYTMSSRGSMIMTHPLSNLTQPTHSLTRFQWVGANPYVDPSSYPGEPKSRHLQRVNPQNPTWAIIPRPANAPVMPFNRGGRYPYNPPKL